MLPAGTYAAVVSPVQTANGTFPIQWGPGTDKSPFTAAVNFEVINGPCAGQKITAFLYFGDTVSKSGKSTAERSIESLRACGFTGDDIDKFSDQNPDIEVQIVVEHETYQGKTRAKVAWINAASRGFTFEKPLDTRSLRKYSAQFKSALKGIPAVAGKKAERQAPTVALAGEPEDLGDDPALDGQRSNRGAPPASDDDIPF